MMDSYKCEICEDVKVESICDYQKFTNGDEFPICNECLEKMIENEEIIESDNVEYGFTKKGLEERLKKIEKELNDLMRYERRYIFEIEEYNK